MATSINFTAAANAVTLESGSGAVTVSVTNTGDAAERIVLGVFSAPSPEPAGADSPAEPVDAARWATVAQPLREIAAGSTESYLVSFDAGSAPAGTYDVRLIAYSADEAPEEHSNPAQTISVIVGESPVEPRKRPPWLLIGLIAALVLAIAGVAAWLLLRSDGVPKVIGSTEPEAQEILTEAGLTADPQERLGPRPFDVVFEQSPEAGSDFPSDNTVTILIATGLATDDLVGLSLSQVLATIGSSAGLSVDGLSTGEAEEQLDSVLDLTIDLPPNPGGPTPIQLLKRPIVVGAQPAGEVLERGDSLTLVFQWQDVTFEQFEALPDIAELIPGF